MSQLNIADFPTEILEKIFSHFDDTTNTIAAGVCKRFNDVLDETVSKKYNGSAKHKWYAMEIYDGSMENEHEMAQHRPYILKRVSALKLSFHMELSSRNHWIYQVLESVGRNIRRMHITTPKIDAELSLNFYDILLKTPKISHLEMDCVYPTNKKWCYLRFRNLINFKLRVRTLLDEDELKPFVKQNGQLKNVELELIDFRLIYAFDKSKIESLRCRMSHVSFDYVTVQIRPMRMSNLKSLNMIVPKNTLNECIEKIVAPCQNLRELALVHFENNSDVLTDQAMEILCSFRSLESFEPCFHMSLPNIVRLISKVPTLVSISLWCGTFSIAECKMLMKEANKHTKLRHIHLNHRTPEIYEYSLLRWLMENLNGQTELEHTLVYKLAVTKGKVQFDGVTIMSSNGSKIEHEKMTKDWLDRIEFIASINEHYYEFFSSLPIPAFQQIFDDKQTDVHVSDETSEASVKRRGKHITQASTIFSSNNDKSVSHLDWLEKYCRGLQALTIYIEANQPHLPEWAFPELQTLRISSRSRTHSTDLSIFASLKCLHLTSLKLVGFNPVRLTNVEVVRDIDLFDNLVTLELFHFNESTNNLLEQFNQNTQRNLRLLSLVNRRVQGSRSSRYEMNNKTVTAISKCPNLTDLKLILPGINKTNTKYLFENCTKLTDLCFECNFLSEEDSYSSYTSYHIFADIKANCFALESLRLVWNDRMMHSSQAYGIKSTFPNVFVKVMQIDSHMHTTAEQVIYEKNRSMERLFRELEI